MPAQSVEQAHGHSRKMESNLRRDGHRAAAEEAAVMCSGSANDEHARHGSRAGAQRQSSVPRTLRDDWQDDDDGDDGHGQGTSSSQQCTPGRHLPSGTLHDVVLGVQGDYQDKERRSNHRNTHHKRHSSAGQTRPGPRHAPVIATRCSSLSKGVNKDKDRSWRVVGESSVKRTVLFALDSSPQFALKHSSKISQDKEQGLRARVSAPPSRKKSHRFTFPQSRHTMSAIKSKDMAAANGAPEPDGLANLSQQDEAEKNALAARFQADQAAGADVMYFDENATPEQKAAAAKKKMNEIKPPKQEPQGSGMALGSDLNGKRVATTMTSAEIDRVSKLEGQAGDGTGPKAGQATSTIPDYYEVGHTGVAEKMLKGQPGLKPGEDDTRKHVETEFVSKYLEDQWYGRFWFDGAACLCAVLATYFATRFGGGIPAMLVIGAVVTTYYNASTRRTRQRYRDDISRELARKKMMSEHETAGWINEFLRRFWLIYEPVLSATVISSVDAALVQQCPSFLDSIRLTTFTLGTKAPIIDFVRTFPATADDEVCMDWKISFTPNDTQDLTVRQAARKVNPKVCLTIRIGRGFVGAGLPILVEDIMFVAHARIKLKLISTFPHIQTVDVSLMEPPKFDFVLKPVGGNHFGFDVMSVVPGLEGFIKGQVDANVGPMLYNPNVFTINLEELLSGTPLDTACGVLQVSVWNARNLRGVKLGGGTPDPYVAISVDEKDVLAKTSYKHSTSNPIWKTSHFVLLNNLNGLLTLNLMDFNDHRSDSKLGTAAFELAQLEKDAEHNNLSTPVMLEGKERGNLQYSLSYYPVIKQDIDPDGKSIPLPETFSGVVRLTIHQAKNLDKHAGILGDLNPKARITLNGNKIKDTAQLKRTNAPIWEEHFEFLVTERRKAVVGVQIVDGHEAHSYLTVKLDDLLSAKDRQQDWFPLAKSKEGRVRMSAEWKPVKMSGSMNGGSGYVPAIGVVKFWLHKAVDVKNVEAAMGGKSDPYACLKMRGQQLDATAIVENNLHPDWGGEILYAPVHSLKERITLEVLDHQSHTRDRSLGTTTIDVADLAAENAANQREPYSSKGKKSHKEKLNLGRNVYKGDVVFDCQFLPSLNLAGVEFKGAGNEVALKAGAGTDDDDGDPDAEAHKAEDDIPALPSNAPTINGKSNPDASSKDRFPVAAGSHSKKDSNASLASLATAKSSVADNEMSGHNEGVKMSTEELLKCQSGILVFNILKGEVARKNARLEIAFDDGYWPTYVTEEARTTHVTWDEVGEATIKELDWSRTFFRLRTGKKDDGHEGILAEFQGNTKDVIERALDKEAEFVLASDAGTAVSKITVTCKYIPTDIHIEAIESVNNMGFLTLWALSASGLRGADRGGKSSDPYVTISLNGERIFKSKHVKKTLNPQWDEKLGECQVTSRVAADALLEVWDYDTVGNPDRLGSTQINLAELEPFESTEKTLKLTGKGALDASAVTIRMVFRPEFILTRVRRNTTFARTLTSGVGGVGRLGVGAVGGVGRGVGTVGKGAAGVVGGVGGAVVGGVGGVGKAGYGMLRGGRRQSHIGAAGGDAAIPGVPELPDGVMPADVTAPGDTSIDNSAALGLRNGDDASLADTTASGKRKSRFHNPFHRKHKE